MSEQPIGGGVKKVLYTLQTVQRIGALKAAKALSAKNACKACAYGMGGQMGGMTNELGEFPSVCNKSVQAQSTDIQPEIPVEIFDHTITDLQELTPYELEHLGRLASPIHKRKDDNRYRPISWDDALDIASSRLGETDPDRSFFYASGRSSNEAAFLFQLLARLYGTNNVTNCSYYCHQATSVALSETIGTGTATVELADLGRSDLIFVIGANPSSNHPRFIHQLKACRERGGEVIIINPAKEPGLVKFAVPKSPGSLIKGGSEIASLYIQPQIGQDIAFFKGLAKALIERGHCDLTFIERYTDGFGELEKVIAETSWTEIVERCGVQQETIERAAQIYAEAKGAVFAWGMGMTHHVHGVENIEWISNIALLRGMIGRPGVGLLPLRGHSNVQGVGTIGVKPVLPSDIIKKIEKTFNVSMPEKQGLDTMGSMQAASRGEVDAAVIMGGNLFAANPNATWAEQALGKIGFRMHLTTTLNQGHVFGVDETECLILPVTARDEEWEPTTQESMFNYVRLSDGGIRRFANVRPESQILADLAGRLLPDCGIDFNAFKKHRHIREAIAEIVPDMEMLADIDVAKKEFHVKNRIMHEPVFRTPSARAQFSTRDHSKQCDAPFILTTVRSEGQFNSIIYEERDSYRQTNTRWCIMLNTDDIEEMGAKAGDVVSVRSADGEMKDVTLYAFDVPRGAALAYYPEANALTGAAIDPRSRTPAFKSTPIWIEKAETA